jgi:hypothetical protein
VKWSWLQNPTVALIEFLAAVMAVGQSVARLSRYIYRLARAEGEEYRGVRIAAALAALVVVLAFSVVTWPVLIALAARGGDHGFMGAQYPLMLDGPAVIGAWLMLGQARARRPFSPMACSLLVIALATAAVASVFHAGSTAWLGVSLTDSAPAFVIAAAVRMVFWLRQET